MDSSEPKQQPTKSPDVEIEYKDARIVIDLAPLEWVAILFSICVIAIGLTLIGIGPFA